MCSDTVNDHSFAMVKTSEGWCTLDRWPILKYEALNEQSPHYKYKQFGGHFVCGLDYSPEQKAITYNGSPVKGSYGWYHNVKYSSLHDYLISNGNSVW